MHNTSVLHLERLRKGAGVSLETISERTKICTRYLRAIESEEFDKLPGGVFSVSYIRQYAVAIGFCETKLLSLYNERVKAEDPAPQAPAPSSQPRKLLQTCWNWLMKPVITP
ncbi:MAG TPA: helix-turn-helix transcriptional regulator [Bryobacteraceae bacterium]|jgi:cytoskeletal protein RodZ|nr:helix-turn-helix transcriptional regulator [Bryobacteraceae bacterium]